MRCIIRRHRRGRRREARRRRQELGVDPTSNSSLWPDKLPKCTSAGRSKGSADAICVDRRPSPCLLGPSQPQPAGSRAVCPVRTSTRSLIGSLDRCRDLSRSGAAAPGRAGPARATRGARPGRTRRTRSQAGRQPPGCRWASLRNKALSESTPTRRRLPAFPHSGFSRCSPASSRARSAASPAGRAGTRANDPGRLGSGSAPCFRRLRPDPLGRAGDAC